jgi:hypothetical protein
MTDYLGLWWSLTFLITPFIICIAGQVITLYMVKQDLEGLRGAFPNSSHIRNQMSIWAGTGFIARYMQVNAICGAIILSGFYIRRGELDPSELERIPKPVKNRAMWSTLLLGIGLTWLALIAIALKITNS